MSEFQKIELAAGAIQGLTAKESITAEEVHGAKGEASMCGQQSGCFGNGG